jgi:hypothetical protein
MADRWGCPRCSNENESWAITCSNCGALRPDLSVGTPPIESSLADRPVESPSTTTVSNRDATPTPPPSTEPASRTAPMWSPATTSGSGVPAANASLATTVARPAPARTGRRFPLRWILVGLFLLAPAISGAITNAGRTSGGAIDKGGDLSASDLRAGDCFDLKDQNAETIDDVHAVPCTTEHQYETFFSGSMPAGSYPTDAAMDDWITGQCDPAFKAYVGVAYENSHLDVFNLTPTKEAWNAGDRSIQCDVTDPNQHRLTESLKGSNR